MHTRRSLKSVIVLATLLVALAPAICQAQKGKKPGGGGGGGGDDGGGGDQSAYAITAFLPPNSTAIASNVQGINDIGDVVGDLDFANGQKVAMHLDMVTGSYTTLTGVLVPFDVNNARQIVGDDGSLGVFLESPGDSAPTTLPPLMGDDYSFATGINDHGIVIGLSLGDSSEVGVVWSVTVDADGGVSVDGPVELPSAADARDINEVVYGDDGTATAQVVGESAGQAVVWTVTVDAAGTLAAPVFDGPVSVPNSGWSIGFGINNFGDVAGQSSAEAFVSFAGGASLPLSLPRRTLSSAALSVNNQLEVVGYAEVGRRTPGTDTAYLWKNGDHIQLSTQIASDSGWDQLSVAASINQLGVIAGRGVKDGKDLGYVMIPDTP